MVAFWLPKSNKIFEKSDLQRQQKKDRFSRPFFLRFWLHLGRSSRPRRPKTVPKGRQDGPKRPPKNRLPASFFGIGRQKPPRAPRDPSKSDFRTIFDRFWCPLSLPKIDQIPCKIRPQKASKRYRFSDPFLIDFGSILDARTSQPRVEITPSYASILRLKAAKTTPEHTHTSISFSFLSSLLRGGFSSAGAGEG